MSSLPALQPYDELNRQLERQVHPPDWVNPTPKKKYHLVVVGAGTAGLVAAMGAAGLGAKVALVERELMGGDCLNVGCVPSKALLAAARVAAVDSVAGDFGVTFQQRQVNFAAVMKRMRKLRADMSHHDSAQRFAEAGIDVFLGEGRFVDKKHVEVEGQKLRFRRAVIATGARAALPSLPGIERVDVLTNETLFSLTTLPQRLLVIGGGPIGAEMAQAFACLGSKVTLIERSSTILSKEDPEAAAVVQKSLQQSGVELRLEAKIDEVLQDESEKRVVLRYQHETEQISADEILVAIGRAPNVDGIGLDRAGVTYDRNQGVEVDDRLKTANKRIFAAGDVCHRYKFTHAAEYMARTVIQNALFPGRSKFSGITIPWATYTSPELAQVGVTEQSAKEQGLDIDTWIQRFDGVDRAILEGATDGFVKIHTRKGKDEIVGATVVASHAGDLVSEITLAMTQGIGLRKLASVVHPYPTTADVIRKIGNQYNRARLTPFVEKMFAIWFRLSG